MDQQIDWVSGSDLAGWPKELCGYVASGLVLTTFSMRSMRRLRLTAIASNAAFIGYAWAADLHPVLVLHCLLLPLNVFRLLQSEMDGGRWLKKTSGCGTEKNLSLKAD